MSSFSSTSKAATALALLRLVSAIAPPQPRPTDPLVGGVDLRGFTPKPTDRPSLFGARDPDLRKRADQSVIGYLAPDNTCGFVHGSIGASKTCATTQVCAAVLGSGVFSMGCCDTAREACTFMGDCIGYKGYYSSSLCDNACQQDVNTVKCTNSNYPYCFSYSVPSANMGFYSCASTFLSTFDPFMTTFLGQTSSVAWKKVFQSSGSASASGDTIIDLPSKSGDKTPGFQLSSTTTGPVSTTTTPPGGTPLPIRPDPVPHKKTSIGAIVGGVIAGLLVLGAIAGLLLIFCMRKRRNKQFEKPAAGAAMGQSGPPAPTDGGAYAQVQQQQPPQQQQQPQYNGQPQYQQQPTDGRVSYYQPPDASQDVKYPQSSVSPILPPYQQAPQQPMQQGPNGMLVPGPPMSPPPSELSAPTQSPPPQSYQPSPIQGQGAQQYPQQQAPAELGNTWAVPTHNTAGQPVYEAPAGR
ncbi:hypothetical protein EJ06DRAFT_583874 [Trichodelitschia bisporula]|uniref:Mid2 domain-containing protein n=1 Tax=Trichodelitschia bisporula TaxID=703511 RepID=A0A6G1HQM5_9PEZI|nr:hypothetical protein EJ06DRAFT_583874 [Trichodelitschia bisporula]